MLLAAVLLTAVAALALTVGGAAAAAEDAYDVLDAGSSAAERGDVRAAVAAFERVLTTPALRQQLPRGHLAQVHYNLGYALQQGGRCGDALPQYDAALGLAPSMSDAYLKAGWCAKEMGDGLRAVGYLQRAAAASPGDAQTHLHLGDLLNNVKRFDDAIGAYQRGLAAALARARGAPAAARGAVVALLSKFYVALGDAHLNVRNATGAAGYYAAGRALNPNDAELAVGYTHAKLEGADWAGLEAAVTQAVRTAVAAVAATARDSPLTPYLGLFIDMPPATRTSLARSVLDAAVSAAEPVPRPTRAHADAVTARWAAITATRAAVVPPPHGLTLGYLSRRFERYPGAQLMLSLFGAHDRATVRVACFGSGPDDGSDERAVISADCDAWQDVSRSPAPATAAAIAAAGVHVLLDYDGAHDFNNIQALTLRPARVVASFLGFAATTGAPRAGGMVTRSGQRAAAPVDFLVADAVIVPPEAASVMATESVWYMPHTYQPQDPHQVVAGGRHALATPSGAAAAAAAAAAVRTDELLSLNIAAAGTAGVADDDGIVWPTTTPSAGSTPPVPFVAASFNRWSKLDPVAWTSWMNLLRAHPRMLLWLYGGGDAPCAWRRGGGAQPASNVSDLPPCARGAPAHFANLWAAAAGAGIHPSRIVFAPRRPRAAHLARHYAVDLLLDSRVYGAHTTAADALFTGVPLVTLAGGGFASRVGTSLSRAVQPRATWPRVGATHSAIEYEEVASRLVGHPRLATALRVAIDTAVGSRVAAAPPRRVPPSSPRTRHAGLFDAAGFAHDLEVMAAAAWELTAAREVAAATPGAAALRGAHHLVLPPAGGYDLQ